MSKDDGCDGSGPFECGGFFHDVLPWWHLISPLFLLFVVGPLLRYGLSQRGEWSGWASLAGRHAAACGEYGSGGVDDDCCAAPEPVL